MTIDVYEAPLKQSTKVSMPYQCRYLSISPRHMIFNAGFQLALVRSFKRQGVHFGNLGT